MKANTIQLNTQDPISLWDEHIFNGANSGDFIVRSEDLDNLTWFSTNYLQYLIKVGKNEVIPLYGNQIAGFEDLIYQVNLSLPVGYRLKNDRHALYDLLLNFESEPFKRVFFWNDAQRLFSRDRKEFEGLFELMAVSAYSNRMGISTLKDDGSRYKVDQRNFFLFHGIKTNELVPILEKKYYIPSIDDQHTETHVRLDFSIIELL